ncbi:MAG TPA: YiiD C-terminal domain-containing protein [Longimicrobiales bacterium]|nr:YiiD C-terminal domain-containing protein [Longimicrobiales bacterium]
MSGRAGDLEGFLYRHIPLARAMGVRVVAADGDGVVLEAPLDVNDNHHGTLFGGSASALAMLSAWGWMHLRLEAEGLDPDLVIQRSAMDFVAPGRADVTARCPGTGERSWRRFLRTYRRFGRARLELPAVVSSGGEVVATLEGRFVALDPGNAQRWPPPG